MDSLEPKKLALLRIMQILHKYSDEKHPLKQEDIAAFLQRDYGVEIERKAIGRNMALLKESGMEIESGREGSFLAERDFSDAELRLLIDGILCSKYVSATHSRALIHKLMRLSNVHFRSHVKNIYSVDERSKIENDTLFYTIAVIDDAIEGDRQIAFDYNKYGADKKLHKTATHTASPYQLMLNNQRYYLMACNERHKNIGYYRVDRITNITLLGAARTSLRSLEGYEQGLDYRLLSSSLPYMYTDRPERVEFLADKAIIDQVVDWFGYDIRITPQDDTYKVTLKVSLQAMEYWAMQYLNAVEILSPPSLRTKIAQNVQNACAKYL